MAQVFDYIVLGLGGFGSAAVYHLAARGLRVLGLEQFETGHDRGSSHGQTRIIRQAYFEHPDYVPLLKRAYQQWQDLERSSHTELANWCGLLLCGPEHGETIAGARLASATHGLTIDTVSVAERSARFPGFRIPADFTTLFEPRAGFLRVEEGEADLLPTGDWQGCASETLARLPHPSTIRGTCPSRPKPTNRQQ